MSVEPLEDPQNPDPNVQYVNGVSSAARQSHGHMLANMAQESGNMPFNANTGAQPKSGNAIAGAFVNMVSPITDPLWYHGANAFATRKTVVASLLNITLITSTAGQLKSLMRINPAYPFFNSLLGMLIVCILAQITMGIMLFFIGRLNLNREEQRSQADFLQNVVMGISVIVLILHIMNTAFGIEDLGYLLPNYPLVVTTRQSATTIVPTILPFFGVVNHTAN